jgi:hypothetical protein
LWEAVRNVTATPGLWRGRLMAASLRARRWLNIWTLRREPCRRGPAGTFGWITPLSINTEARGSAHPGSRQAAPLRRHDRAGLGSA